MNAKPLFESIRRFVENDSGATAIEYSLIVSLIFLAIVAAVRSFTDSASVMYNVIDENLVDE